MSSFIECDICRPKSGTPYLCKPCLNNREIIERLDKQNDILTEIIENLRLYDHAFNDDNFIMIPEKVWRKNINIYRENFLG